MIFQKKQFPNLISLHKIWEHEMGSIDPYIIYFRDFWLCAFREYSDQTQKQGAIRLIISKDKTFWSSIQLLKDPLISFNNPKLSITADNKLMLLLEGWSDQGSSKQSYVAFSEDAFNWSIPIPILESNKWLWDLIWRRGKGFAICTSNLFKEDQKRIKEIEFLLTQDGLNFLLITNFDILGDPLDASLAFQKDKLLCVIRREARGDNYALIGRSVFPFYAWEWQATQYHIKDPVLVVNDEQEDVWVVGCLDAPTPYGMVEKIALMRLYLDGQLEPVLTLPSNEEVGSPSILIKDHRLFICYHSHKNARFSIQLAEIDIS